METQHAAMKPCPLSSPGYRVVPKKRKRASDEISSTESTTGVKRAKNDSRAHVANPRSLSHQYEPPPPRAKWDPLEGVSSEEASRIRRQSREWLREKLAVMSAVFADTKATARFNAWKEAFLSKKKVHATADSGSGFRQMAGQEVASRKKSKKVSSTIALLDQQCISSATSEEDAQMSCSSIPEGQLKEMNMPATKKAPAKKGAAKTTAKKAPAKKAPAKKAAKKPAAKKAAKKSTTKA